MRKTLIVCMAIIMLVCTSCGSVDATENGLATPSPAPTDVVNEEPLTTVEPAEEATMEPQISIKVIVNEDGTIDYVTSIATAAPEPTPSPIVIVLPVGAQKPEETQKDNTSKILQQSDVPSLVIDADTYFTYAYGTVFNNFGVYECDDTLTRGALETENLSSVSDKVLDFETYYGLTAYAEGYNLYVKAYSHYEPNNVAILASKIISDTGDSQSVDISYEDSLIIDCSEFKEGLYAIQTWFDTMDMRLYFYVGANGVFTCRCNEKTYLDVETLLQRGERVENAITAAGITPENSLSNDDIFYPCVESEGHRCDTDKWVQLSYDLLNGHSEWSDEYKMFVYTEWFIDNIRYDHYRTDVLGSSRALAYGVWDGTYSMWDLGVGVCADFSNVMVIMLREQGIPVTSLESETHMWNAVYIDGIWRELDLTGLIPGHSYEEDASDCKMNSIYYSNYCNYYFSDRSKSHEIKSVGADIWTYKRITTGSN